MEISYDSFMRWPRLTKNANDDGSANFSVWAFVTKDGSKWRKAVYLDVFIYPIFHTCKYRLDYNDTFRLSPEDEEIVFEGMIELIRATGVDLEGFTYERL